MNKWSNISKQRLDTCHADLQLLFNTVLPFFDCTVLEGHRSVTRQQELYRQGRETSGAIVTHVDGINKLSKHNHTPSQAVDIVPYPVNWGDTSRMYHFAGFVKATALMLQRSGLIEHELRWGGDWDNDTHVDDQSFMDLPHFEIIIP